MAPAVLTHAKNGLSVAPGGALRAGGRSCPPSSPSWRTSNTGWGPFPYFSISDCFLSLTSGSRAGPSHAYISSIRRMYASMLHLDPLHCILRGRFVDRMSRIIIFLLLLSSHVLHLHLHIWILLPACDQADSRCLPFARRRLSTRRPFRVAKRARKPWRRLRTRLEGW